MASAELSLERIRKLILVALFSDDELLTKLVLKGGNALALVHEVGNRASVDMDFSIEASFEDFAVVQSRLFETLRREFAQVGYQVFDERLMEKPSVRGNSQPEWWGGYLAEFKIIRSDVFAESRDDLDTLRRRAVVVGPDQRRTYTIDISKHEYCAAKVRREVDHYTVYVYSLEMIAIEKLRAICQQMPQYEVTRNKTARARDFYDIHEIVAGNDIDLASLANLDLFRHIFSAKGVPLALLGEIQQQMAFHELDWPAVEDSISGKRHPFQYYFDFVVQQVSRLETLWKE